MYCLPNIIGLSRNECGCFSDPGDEGFNVLISDSDLYLDDLVAIDLAKITDCSATGPWKTMRQAYLETLIDFKRDFRKALMEKYKIRHLGKSQWMGERDVNPPSAAHDVKGAKIVGNGIQGSYLEISKFRLYTNAPNTTFTVMLLDEYGSELFSQEFTIATSGQWSDELDIAPAFWKVPLWVEGDKAPIYYLVHDNPSTVENDRACLCHRILGKHFSDVLFQTGVYSDGLTEESFKETMNYGGFQYFAETACEVEYEVCDLVGDDYMIAATVIQHGAAARFIEKVLKKQVSGFASTVSIEVMQQQIEGFAGQYASGLINLVKNIVPGNCYYCKETGFKKRNVLGS